MLKSLVRRIAMKTGRLSGLYVRMCRPDSGSWGQFMARWGGLHSIGKDVWINVACNITDPAYVRLGNNISLSACTLLGHDGVIRVLSNAYGKKLDSVGKIDIRDNSFVGHGAIVMPGVTIGPNSIVAAGAVVTGDVPPGWVVGGIPAKKICPTEQLVARMEARTESYPWKDLIYQREGPFDPVLEPRLQQMRVEHFYGREESAPQPVDDPQERAQVEAVLERAARGPRGSSA